MKRYDEYTKQELAEVSQDTLNLLVELEVAYAGILPAVNPEPVINPITNLIASEIAYELYGLKFKDIQDAETVSKMAIFDESYDYNGTGYDYKWLKEKESYQGIKTVKYYNQNDVVTVKKELTAYKKAKDNYEKENTAYTKFSESISSIRDKVYSTFYEAKNFVENVAKAKLNYEKFLALADNDEIVAKKFFADAYKSSPEIANAVIPGSTVGVTEEAND